VCLIVLLAITATVSVVWAEDYTYNIVKDSHKVKNKWDLSGTFVAHPGYNWGGLAEGATWSYSIHIKEAMNGDVSVGSIRFWTADGIEVVGHVEATDRYYNYWSGDNLAAVGRTQYNGATYDFMFLYAERAVWFAISDVPYDAYWAIESVWPHSLRSYQLHSKVPDETFTLDYKVIHE
jgi:hypothetical protein